MSRLAVPVVPVLIVALLILGDFTFPPSISSFVHTIATPVWTLQDKLFHIFENEQGFFQSKENLLYENNLLRNENSKLRRETFLTRSYKIENIKLQKLLGRVEGNSGLLTAAVIHGETFSSYDTFIIDLGEQDGVRDNMLIISPEDIAIGYVAKTLQKTAVVKRFSAPDTNITGVVNASTSMQAILTGHGGGTMKVSLPRDVPMAVGDYVILPTFTTYPIGEIFAIEVSPEDAYKIVYVQSNVNIYELRYVLIDTTTTWSTDPFSDVLEFKNIPKPMDEDENTNE